MNDGVTFCISTFNNEKYISETFKVLVEYDWTIPVTFVVSDDASTDNTVEIIKNIIREHKNQSIRLLSNSVNVGGSGNFVRMLDFIDTKYMMFLDGDDFYECSMIEKLYFQIEKTEVNALSGYMNQKSKGELLLQFTKITFFNFCLGKRFPITACIMKNDDVLLGIWKEFIPKGPRNQGDLTLCLSLLVREPVYKFPLYIFDYNERNKLGETNYNSITSNYNKIKDRFELVCLNYKLYWKRPSYYCIFIWFFVKSIGSYLTRMFSKRK